ncbi:BrnT family toxin [Glaciimonas sp. GG7]
MSFEDAMLVFFDPDRLDEPDGRKDYGEERRIVIGEIEGHVFVVVYTLRGEAIRLISARKSNEREQRKYRALRA